MKQKFLAKAITLGLMLAVPLGAQAKTINTATDDNKVFPNGLELSITSANASNYSGEELHFYDVTKAGEEVKGDVTFNMSDFDNGTNKIITIQTTAENATSTINGNVNVTGNNITANRVMGILASSDKSSITVNGDVKLDIKNSANRIYAVYTENNAQATVNGNVTVNATNINTDYTQGVYTRNNSQANVKGNVSVTADNAGGNVLGVNNASGNATVGGSVTVTADNATGYVHGVNNTSGNATVGGSVTVTADNATGYVRGVEVQNKSQATVGGSVTVTADNASGNVHGVNNTSGNATVGGSVTVTADNATGYVRGVEVQNKSQATVGGSVTVNATNSKEEVLGVATFNEAQATIGGSVSVNATDVNSYVYGVYTGNTSQATVGGNITVTATNTTDSVVGIKTTGTSQATVGGSVDVNITNIKTANIFSAAYLLSTGTAQIGTAAKPADINLRVIGTKDSDFTNARIETVASCSTLTHYGNANLYLENIGAMSATRDNISGYWIAKGNAKLTGDVNVTYVATADRADATLNQNIYGVSVGEQSNPAAFNHTGNVNVYLAGKAEKMGLDNNTVYGSVVGTNGTYNHTNGLRTLYFGTDKVTFASSDANPFKGSFTNFDVIKVNKGSTLVLDTTQKAGFTGDQDFLGNVRNPSGGYADLPAGSSQVNGITSKGGTLTLGNDNTIIVDDGASAKIATVTSNAGNIVVNGADKITIDSLTGDKATITTDTVKNSLIDIGSNSNTSLTVIGNSKASDMLTGNDSVEDLQKVADTVMIRDGEKRKDIFVEQGTILGSMQGKTDENGKVIAESVSTNVNTDNEAISNMASISLMTWRQENNDMNKRLGELRDSKGEHGAWARMARGESKYGAQNIKNQYNYYQVGYDEKLSVNPDWTVGVALTRTEGSSSFTNGSAENKHTGVAVYGSYLKDDGSFIDLIAKYARMKNEFTVNGGAGNGDYETNGYSLSAEYGKRFTKDNGFWIEPQVELTYGYVGAAGYLSSNGANVRQDGMDSLVGRLGFSLGRNIKAGNVYARASYLYDFDGETDVSFSKGTHRSSFKQDLGGGWWEVGVGTNLNLSDAAHLYFDVEKTYGGNVATPWQWNAGVRWSF